MNLVLYTSTFPQHSFVASKDQLSPNYPDCLIGSILALKTPYISFRSRPNLWISKDPTALAYEIISFELVSSKSTLKRHLLLSFWAIAPPLSSLPLQFGLDFRLIKVRINKIYFDVYSKKNFSALITFIWQPI